MVSSTDDGNNGLTSKRTIIFRGKPEHWDPFIQQWLAYYASKGYVSIFDGTETVPTKAELDAVEAKAEASRTRDDKKVLKIHGKNVTCFNQLLISIDASTTEGRLAYHLVITCKKDEYPLGNAKMAYDKLVSKYAPKNTQTELSLRKQLANTKLETGDPDEFMMRIEVLAMDINAMNKSTSNVTDEDLMAHALNNLPSEYDAITDGLERQFNEGKLTLDILREKLQSRYKRLAQIESEDMHSPETALAAIATFKKRFKGVCWVCGKRGHKSNECRDKKVEEKANVAVEEDSESDDDFCL